jgi:1-acyl-sn-glycerol-3-phosphate acyltransferase
MRTFRGLLFTIVMYGAGGLCGTLIVLFFWAPFRVRWLGAVGWAKISLWAADFFCGLKVSTEGTENIPDKPCVFLIKHTTTLETFWQIDALPPSAWVLTRELLWIPFFGWGLSLGMRSIAIDRKSGGTAIKQVIQKGQEKLASGISVCIFPEGTRMPPGETRRYGVSGAALAKAAGCPIVPIAHNSGDFWPKRGLRKEPGHIRFCIGPPIDAAGRPPKETNLLAQEWVENKMGEISRFYKNSAGNSSRVAQD